MAEPDGVPDGGPAGVKDRGAPPTRSIGGVGIAVGVLLAIGIIVPLLVPIYDQGSPRFLGFPFYYWFQFLLIPVVSLLAYIAFRLSLRSTDKERAAVGLPPSTERDGDR
jgi:membrane protein implicated in regulation of membrane protease activity